MFVVDTWIAFGFWTGLWVVIVILFATDVMLADGISGQKCETVVVMLLLFTLTAVMKFIIACARGCTSGNDFARMFDLCTSCQCHGLVIFVVSRWIVLGCWVGLLVVIYLFVLKIILADVVCLDGGIVMVYLSCLATHNPMFIKNRVGPTKNVTRNAKKPILCWIRAIGTFNATQRRFGQKRPRGPPK
jgi:hypothetical protein